MGVGGRPIVRGAPRQISYMTFIEVHSPMELCTPIKAIYIRVYVHIHLHT